MKCAALVLGVLLFAANVDAQVLQPAAQSPHFPHINIFDYGRAYVSGSPASGIYDWFASHVDAAEIHSNGSSLTSRNATMKLSVYHVDQSEFQNAFSQALPEQYFLHFAEDTVIDFYELDGSTFIERVSITGCPAPSAVTLSCRVQVMLWTDKRYVYNPDNAAYRTYMKARLQSGDTIFGDVTGGATTHIVWLDEHSVGFSGPTSWNWQSKPISGGLIREYNDTPGDWGQAFDQLFNAKVVDWLEDMRTAVEAGGKRILLNTWMYAITGTTEGDLVVPRAIAANGLASENLHQPDTWDGPAQYSNFKDTVSTITSSGGTVQLQGTWGASVPVGYTAGNYASAMDRYKMWRLASYYILKEPVGSSGLVYFDPSFASNNGTDPADDQTEWILAYQFNIGQPSSVVTSAATGSAAGCSYEIFQRQYTNALVLVRPQDGLACTTYGNTSGATVNLNRPMRVLQADGTLGSEVTSVTIRNAEAVIAFFQPAQKLLVGVGQ
jgi:hypothetical protein